MIFTTLGPQQPMEKWGFSTPKIWVKSPLKMKVMGLLAPNIYPNVGNSTTHWVDLGMQSELSGLIASIFSHPWQEVWGGEEWFMIQSYAMSGGNLILGNGEIFLKFLKLRSCRKRNNIIYLLIDLYYIPYAPIPSASGFAWVFWYLNSF